jgi:hypothetical protein
VAATPANTFRARQGTVGSGLLADESDIGLIAKEVASICIRGPFCVSRDPQRGANAGRRSLAQVMDDHACELLRANDPLQEARRSQ